MVPVAAGAYVDANTVTYADYDDFTQNGWEDWRAAVSASVDASIGTGADLDPLPDWPVQADALDGAVTAAQRHRAGTYEFIHNDPRSELGEYILSFSDQIAYYQLSMLLDTMVFPDGDMLGIGPTTTIPRGTGGDCDEGEDECLLVEQQSSDLLVLAGGAQLDSELYLDSPGASVVTQTMQLDYENPAVALTELELAGRFIGNIIYDGLPVNSLIDFTEDYRIADGEEIYDLTEAGNEQDRGRLGGLLQGDSFGGAEGLGFRAARTATVAGSLDRGIQAMLPDFYRLTFFKACPDDDPQPVPFEQTACGAIPAAEVSETPDGDPIYANYPPALPGDTSDTVFEVSQEQRREYVTGVDNGEVYLQILDDGTLVTDRDADCSAVDGSLMDNDIQEYKVGFVTRTLEDDDTGRLSVNVIIYLVGDKALADTSGDYIPQFGTLTQGRIDLGTADVPSTVMPFYRLSDDNFELGIRAAWKDLYQSREFAVEAYDSSLPPAGQEPVKLREFATLTTGAVAGRAMASDGMGGCE